MTGEKQKEREMGDRRKRESRRLAYRNVKCRQGFDVNAGQVREDFRQVMAPGCVGSSAFAVGTAHLIQQVFQGFSAYLAESGEVRASVIGGFQLGEVVGVGGRGVVSGGVDWRLRRLEDMAEAHLALVSHEVAGEDGTLIGSHVVAIAPAATHVLLKVGARIEGSVVGIEVVEDVGGGMDAGGGRTNSEASPLDINVLDRQIPGYRKSADEHTVYDPFGEGDTSEEARSSKTEIPDQHGDAEATDERS
jgi:hypothetical protein